MQNLNAVTTELTTIRDYIRWGVSQFNAAEIYFGHGTDNAWDESIYLVLYALHLTPNQDMEKINAILDAKLTMLEREKVAALLWQRVKERKPASYLTHTAYFAGLEFYVDERVLIPRSPLAELIEKQFAPWLEFADERAENAVRILDVGTGSGCLAIACAHAFPEAQVDAIDISADALAVAKINVDKHFDCGVGEKVRLLQSDLFAAPELQNEKYDVIISNPPYVSIAEMKKLPHEYSHEPAVALVAGEDGLIIAERLLREGKKHLNENGILIVEVGNSAETLMEQYPQVPFVWLEFAHGESEIFLLTLDQLKQYF